jgi:protein TonB
MVRAPAHALPRHGFAVLKPASKPQLDSARILTMSGTLALNLLAMGLLMMPLSMPAPLALPDAKPRDVVRWIPREKEEPIKVKIVKEQTPTPPVAASNPQPRTAPTPIASTSSDVVVDGGTEYVPPAATEVTGPTESIPAASATPSPMQLQYRSAPAPAYPRRAQQQRLTGTVLLQVLVGIDGRPVEVKVAQSSGHRELDEAARAQVLKRWSFQPATKDGLAVQAIGMVPIEFALR